MQQVQQFVKVVQLAYKHFKPFAPLNKTSSCNTTQHDAFPSQGERDYSQIKGQTGPLVYPAGFLYIYTALSWLTQGGQIAIGQIIFTALYLINQALVMSLYIQSQAVPPWALTLLCVSKRIHSIFILRMFNDSITMMLAYTACLLLIKRKWRLAVFLFSAALSVKMNVLLMAPPVLIIMLQVSFSHPCTVSVDMLLAPGCAILPRYIIWA